MFTFIKKVIKTGTQTSRYPLEPMPVDKNFRGKPEHNPQQCIGCAACVNACPSNALTVETDLKTGELAWQFNLGRCIFCGRCEKFARRSPFACRRSTSWQCGRKPISSSSRVSRCVTAASASVRSPCKKRSTTPSRCCSTTVTSGRNITVKVLKPARSVSVRNACCRPTGLISPAI